MYFESQPSQGLLFFLNVGPCRPLFGIYSFQVFLHHWLQQHFVNQLYISASLTFIGFAWSRSGVRTNKAVVLGGMGGLTHIAGSRLQLPNGRMNFAAGPRPCGRYRDIGDDPSLQPSSHSIHSAPFQLLELHPTLPGLAKGYYWHSS